MWCRGCTFFDSPTGLSCNGCYEDHLCSPEDLCEFVKCVEKRRIEHCGLCDDFPCEQLIGNYQVCTGENGRLAVFRIGDLAVRARIGSSAWMQRKLDGSLPLECASAQAVAGQPKKEKRRTRRNEGQWQVAVSFLPGPAAFGLSNVQVRCANASPSGMMLILPETAWEGFAALVRTERSIEVYGEFPTAYGPRAFSGHVVWHSLNQSASNGDLRVGVRLVVSAEKKL
jgi:hypothetical protein